MGLRIRHPFERGVSSVNHTSHFTIISIQWWGLAYILSRRRDYHWILFNVFLYFCSFDKQRYVFSAIPWEYLLVYSCRLLYLYYVSRLRK